MRDSLFMFAPKQVDLQQHGMVMVDSVIDAEGPPSKKPKRGCHFDRSWIQEFKGRAVSSKGE